MRTPRGLHVEIREPEVAATTPRRPIVFHHGIGTNHRIWDGWLPAIGPDRGVARFDLRGFGRSDVPDVTHKWTMQELVDDLFEVVDLAAGATGRAHLVGESLGGTVVLLAAILRPDRIASVTISNAAFKGTGIHRVAGWREEIAHDGMAGWAARMMELRFRDGVLAPEKAKWFADVQAASPAHVVLGLGELLAVQDLSTQLAAIKAPLLILMPTESPFVPVEQARELGTRVQGASLVLFHGVRHGLPYSHAEACARHLAGFLQRIDPA